MNREKLKAIRVRTATGGFLEQVIDAILEEPREPWPGEIAEARLKAEVDQLKTWLQLCRNDVEAITKANNAWQAENRDLTAQVEGLTAERDAARVGLANKIEECKRLREYEAEMSGRERDAEKQTRIKYQSMVYKFMNWMDNFIADGGKVTVETFERDLVGVNDKYMELAKAASEAEAERDAARVALQNKIEECKRLRDDLDATVEIVTERGRQCERLGFERDSAIATAQQREQDVSDLRVELAACKEERDGLKAKCGYLYGAPKKMTIIDKINEAVQIEKDNLDTLAKVAAKVAPEIERLATARGLDVAVFASDEMIDFVMQPKCGTRRLTINAYDNGTLGQSRVDVGGCPSVGHAPLDRSGIADAIAWLAEVPS